MSKEENGRKSFWAITLEYLLAAPILGIPCYLTVTGWADRSGIPVVGIILVGAFHIALAIYQLKRTHHAATSDRTNLYRLGGVVFLILSLFSIAFLLQHVTPITPDYNVQGTASTTNMNSMVMIFSSFVFGYFLGFAALFLGYVGIQPRNSSPPAQPL